MSQPIFIYVGLTIGEDFEFPTTHTCEIEVSSVLSSNFWFAHVQMEDAYNYLMI